MTYQAKLPKVKLTYTDDGHEYRINGVRASGVSTTAKIPPSSFAIEQYDRRMVAIGCALDHNICENILMDLEDKDHINKQVKDAKYVAKQHVKADRGTQKHRVLELILTGREHQLLSQQQRDDADILKRTLDAYKLTPHEGLVEQFVCYPEHSLCGRFDVVMERNDGSLVVVDLKGLALNTLLPTPFGWTTMAAVTVGDQVLGSNGVPCNVIAKSNTKCIGTYVVTFDDGTKVTCDSEHIWWTTTELDRRHNRPPSSRSITEIIDTLKYGGQKQHWVPISEPLQLPEVELPIAPYLLGAWLGDGHVRGGQISKEDGLFDILESDGHELGIRRPYKTEKCVCRTVIGLTKALRLAGLQYNKHIPIAYLRGSHHQRLRLLQGLMDTDGTWNIKRKTAVFNSCDKTLALSVEELLVTLGQRPHFAEFQATGFGKTVTAYAVEFTPRDIKPFRLPHKAEKATQTTKSLAYSSRRLIVDVQPGPDVETACIAVDSLDSIYLCSEHMIPTHNSGPNAVLYPQTTMVQLALYARAPMVSEKIEKRSGKQVVDVWRTMPPSLDLTRAYVLLVENNAKIGTFHRLDIEHGWTGATLALGVLQWRKQLGYNGRGGAIEVSPQEATEVIVDESVTQGFISMAARATNRLECTMLAKNAKDQGAYTDELRDVLNRRWVELKADA